MVLGPDRVGKSTLVKKIDISLQGRGASTACLHFSGPKPWHKTPIDQYILPIESVPPTTDWIICDRGGCEVCFYEKFRRGVSIDISWALKFEDYVSSHFKTYKTLLLKRDWEWSEPKHLEEILLLNPNCSDSFIRQELSQRFKEHHSYYKYMSRYFKNHSKHSARVLKTNDLEDHQLYKILRVFKD